MNQDFAEMLAALSGAGADYLVIGAHAVAVHANPRATGDLDLCGVTFDEAWPRRAVVSLWGQPVPVIGREDLIASKRAAGRPQDLADIVALERARPSSAAE
jgi:hypothetical protein